MQLHRSLLGGLPLVGPLGGLPEATQTAAQSRSLGVRRPDLDHGLLRDAGQDASASDPLHSDERKSLVFPRFPTLRDPPAMYIQRDMLYVLVHLRLDGSAPAAAGSRIT